MAVVNYVNKTRSPGALHEWSRPGSCGAGRPKLEQEQKSVPRKGPKFVRHWQRENSGRRTGTESQVQSQRHGQNQMQSSRQKQREAPAKMELQSMCSCQAFNWHCHLVCVINDLWRAKAFVNVSEK